MQADGKILVAGSSMIGGGYGFALARYNVDGSLDTSFDADGKVITAIGANADGSSVTLQADGKILVAGGSWNGSGGVVKYDFALARYTTDGSLDTTFDTDGKVTTSFGVGSSSIGNSVTVQADGKILVAGSNWNGSSYDFALARYNANGSLDSSFDGDGKITTAIGGNTNGAYSIILQADGKILVSGDGNGKLALARYNIDGSLDTNFGNTAITLNGTATFTENGAAVVLDSAIKIADAELAASGNYAGASLTLTRNGGANVQDVFSSTGTLGALTEGGSLNVGGFAIGTVTTNSGGTLTLAFNSSATQSLVNLAMQQIAYSNSFNTSNAPPAPVRINWTFNDGNSGAQGTGGALSITGSTTVSITPIPAVTQYGTEYTDTLTGTSGIRNVIHAGGENDTVNGGSGSDWLDGGAGVDTLTGGAGDDIYVINNIYDQVVESSTGLTGGNDTVRADIHVDSLATGLDKLFSFAGFSRRFTRPTVQTPNNVEILVLENNSSAQVMGNSLNNRLTGNGEDNVLNGMAGDDVLIGGGGHDTLTGGTGADTFVLDRIARMVASISDFNATEGDRIGLASNAYGGLFDSNGALRAGVFTDTQIAAATTTTRLLYDALSGALRYDSDGSGALASVQVATLTNNSALDANAFVLAA